MRRRYELTCERNIDLAGSSIDNGSVIHHFRASKWICAFIVRRIRWYLFFFSSIYWGSFLLINWRNSEWNWYNQLMEKLYTVMSSKLTTGQNEVKVTDFLLTLSKARFSGSSIWKSNKWFCYCSITKLSFWKIMTNFSCFDIITYNINELRKIKIIINL